MKTSLPLIENRPVPVRGAGCCIELLPSTVDADEGVARADAFAALAEPTWLQILGLLAAQPAPLCVCEINAAFPLGQPTISHHLKQLRDAGLVRSEKRGLWVYYRVVPEAVNGLAGFLQGVVKSSRREVSEKWSSWK